MTASGSSRRTARSGVMGLRRAEWSPFGRFVVATRDARARRDWSRTGDVHWTLAQRNVHFAAVERHATDTRIAYVDRRPPRRRRRGTGDDLDSRDADAGPARVAAAKRAHPRVRGGRRAPCRHRLTPGACRREAIGITNPAAYGAGVVDRRPTLLVVHVDACAPSGLEGAGRLAATPRSAGSSTRPSYPGRAAFSCGVRGEASSMGFSSSNRVARSSPGTARSSQVYPRRTAGGRSSAGRTPTSGSSCRSGLADGSRRSPRSASSSTRRRFPRIDGWVRDAGLRPGGSGAARGATPQLKRLAGAGRGVRGGSVAPCDTDSCSPPPSSTPPRRFGRRGPAAGTSTARTTSPGRRPVTARRRLVTISSSAGRSGSSATSSRASRSPFADPYTFPPEASARPNLQGWLFGLPFWPVGRTVGNVWAYDVMVLLSFVLAGGLACWWLRSLGVPARQLSSGASCSPHAVSRRPVDGAFARAGLVPLAGGAARARATAVRARRARARRASAVRAATPRHRGDSARAGYTWARLPRAVWWKAGGGGRGGDRRRFVVGTVGHGLDRREDGPSDRSTATRQSSPTSYGDVGSGIEQFVFIGLGDTVHRARRARRGRGRRGLAVAQPRRGRAGAARPRRQPARLPHPLDLVPGLDSTRVPERLMPVACLAVAALVAFAVERQRTFVAHHHKRFPAFVAARRSRRRRDRPARAAIRCGRGRRPNASYAAMPGKGRLLELPVFRPDIHFGSVFLAYARQTPRERPQGYSTARRAPRGRPDGAQAPWSLLRPGDIRPRSASASSRSIAASTGQSGFFGSGCPARAEVALRRAGWRPVARDGPISTFAR